MQPSRDFRAPWGVSLRLLTVFSALLLLAIPVAGLIIGARENIGWVIVLLFIPLLVLFGSAFFIINGYRLTGDRLAILRPWWQTEVSLDRLDSAVVDPQAMRRSIRLLGNGGLFCYAGWFRNRRLGRYRAFATDPSLAVVLRFPGHTIVVTPDQPQRFVDFIDREQRL